MAFRTLGEDADESATSPDEGRIPGPKDVEAIKNLFSAGDTDKIAETLRDMGAPEEIIEKLANLQPIMKQAVDEAIDDLCDKARRSIMEQKASGGVPGPEWKEYMEAIQFYFHLSDKDRLESLVIARVIYLLVACIQEIGDGEPIQIDPMTYDYPID